MHLPSTQKNELSDLNAAIQNAQTAGAENCAPAELAKAEAKRLYAAHEIDEHGGYNMSEAEDLIASGMAAAKAAKEKCSQDAVKVVKAKPVPVSMPTVIVPVKPVEKAKVIALDGVFFENNSAKLTGASTTTLNNAVDALKQQSGINVEVAAYTDSRGKASYNEYLSGLRADSVQAYLVSHGIDASRVTAKGYGEANPVADNKTREGRSENRRVELIIQ
ncbi:MAG: OmpA family protein [Ghiorsea sp.]